MFRTGERFAAGSKWAAFARLTKLALATIVVLSVGSSGCNAVPPTQATVLLQMSNRVTAELSKPLAQYIPSATDTATHHAPFFEDAYGVSALGKAYQLNHNTEYLSASVSWTEQMIAYQGGMTPPGAYYMNYNRAPGQRLGDWYVADSATIAAAILRTSALVSPYDGARYLQSVQSFAALVSANYVNADGGISNGIWGNYKESWWASTVNFGALAFMLYAKTGDSKYLSLGQGAFDWLVSHDISHAIYPTLAQDGPAIAFYYGEFYAEALPYVRGTSREALALQQMQLILQWISENQKSQNQASTVDYSYNTHMAGLPHVMYSTQSFFPAQSSLANAEMSYLSLVLSQNPDVSQASPWALLTWFTWSETARLGI